MKDLAISDAHQLLNAKQKAAVRWIKENVAPFIDRSEMQAQTELGDEEYVHLLSLLAEWKAVEIVPADTGSYADAFIVNALILEVVRQLDNPPTPDHWDNATKWFRSKKWSLPHFLIFLIVGLTSAWLDLIQKLIGLFGDKK